MKDTTYTTTSTATSTIEEAAAKAKAKTSTNTANTNANANAGKSAPSPETLAAAREAIRAFGQHYDYDVSYMEALMDASPGAFQAFEGAMGMSRYQSVAPAEILAIAKITAMRVEDCGPCAELGLKMGREAGVPESVLRGALRGGKGLSPEHLDIHLYARAVAANEVMDPDLLPRLEARWGRAVLAELAVAIAGARIYPTVKRGLGYAQSCSLVPGLLD